MTDTLTGDPLPHVNLVFADLEASTDIRMAV